MMFILSILSEALLFLCFSILVGYFLLNLVPKDKRPEVFVPKGLLLLAAIGIALLSFLPVLKLILYLYKDMGLGITIQSVLTNFEVGKSWMTIGIVSAALFVFLIPIKVEDNQYFPLIGLFLTLVLISALGFSSHASSLSKWPGFFAFTSHFFAINIWTGILLSVSWFSKKHNNWLEFLKWFTPVAVGCLVIVLSSGMILMTFVMKLHDYTNAWALSYGQTLLIKHLAIIPLLGFAFINSVLIRKKLMSDPSFNPIPWSKLESLMILIIFSITGALGQEDPPHNIANTIKTDGTSKLFHIFHKGELSFPLHLSLGFPSILLIFISIFFLFLLICSFIKKTPKFITILLALFVILSGYIAAMVSIH